MKRLIELLERAQLAWSILLHGGPRPARRAPSAPAPLPLFAPPPVQPAPVPALPPYIPITEKHLDEVRGIARREDWHEIRLCRGPRKGCNRYCAPPEDCSSCFVVPWHERRASAELLRAMERGDA